LILLLSLQCCTLTYVLYESGFLFVNLRVLCGFSYFSALVINAPTSFFSSPKEESWMYIMCPAP